MLIIGKNPKIDNYELTAAIMHYFNELGFTINRWENIELEVSFDRTDAVKGWLGYTITNQKEFDRHIYTWVRPTMKKDRQLITLAHEIVHVWQYVEKVDLSIEEKENEAYQKEMPLYYSFEKYWAKKLLT